MAKREYIQSNKDWLEAKAKEEGVKALPKGIYYKVLSEGNQDSPKPTVRSIITAHYTGKTIDGKQFDSSRGGVPLACRLCDVFHAYTKQALKPKKTMALIMPVLYYLLGKKRLYKMIAKGEYDAAVGYEHLIADFPEVESVKNDEKRHGDIVSGLLDT